MAEATTRARERPQPEYQAAPKHWQVLAGDCAPEQARDIVERFAAALPTDVRERARLLASELVTNSVVHTHTRHIDIEAWTLGGGLDVVVRDDGSGFTDVPRAAGHDDGSGWGLILVDMLAESWATGGPGEPWVWFHVESRESVATAEPLTETDPLRDRVGVLLDVRLLLDSVKDYAIFGLDTLGHVTIWNSGAERITGYRSEDILGSGVDVLFDDPGSSMVDADLSAAIAKGRHEREHWLVRKDGSRIWADTVLTPIHDAKGALRGFAEVAHDVTWRKRLDEDRAVLLHEIQSLARTDDLTGLANRRRWHEELDRELARARRRGAPICIALLDLDGFKAFNDSEGHPAGDRLLCAAARAWGHALRATDLLARHGGDEFAVLLPDCPLAEALVVIERMRVATPKGVTASVGVTCTYEADQTEQLMARVDVALYDAKRRGRNTVVAA